jgi:cation diffusion facilitator family transporter
MAHHRRAIANAVLLNTAISVVEGIAGYQAGSLSLLMDSVHNLSDEMALVALWLAFIVSRGPSRTLLRGANLFNSIGLMAISGVLLWQAAERLLNPPPVLGIVPVAVGLPAAAANYGVALLLREPSEANAAVRLAYIHNLGDAWLSLAPVAAGLLLVMTRYSFFDSLIAGGVAIWIIISTAREVVQSQEELIWPDRIICGHTQNKVAADSIPH